MQPDVLVKNIRSTLMNKKKKLEEYLSILEKEEDDLQQKDPDLLEKHIKLETSILDELVAFQKILDPLENIYVSSPYKKDSLISKLKDSISHLSNQVEAKSTENRERLSVLLEEIKADLKGFKQKNRTRSIYNSIDSRVLDING